MTVERRLRDAMQARVEGVDAPAMAVRPERMRRVWPAVAAGFAIVLVVVVVVALIARHDGGDAVHPAATPYPSRVVAVMYDGRLVVLDSRTGHVVRTLARDADASNGHAGVSVSPDGKLAYYTRTTTATCDENLDGKQDPITDIAAVRVNGQGRAMRIASNVRWPAVSPDGRYLAYSGIPNCSDAGQSIVVSGLVPGARSLRFDSVNVPAGTPGTVAKLAWAPDSRHVVFRWDVLGSYPWILDTASATAVDDGHRVDISDGSGVDGYLGDRGNLLGTSAQAPPLQHQDVIAIDAATGARVRTLFEIPEPCCGAVATSDGTGRNVLVSGARLYRWSEGERRPTRIATRIAAAGWVPNARRQKVVATPPKEVVAVTTDGRLVVVSAQDGHILRNLADDAVAASGLSVSPDGRTAYYARDTGGRCSTGDPITTIATIPIEGGIPTDLVTNVRFPAVSPDGRYLAFTGIPNCSDVGRSILLRDLTVDAHTNGSYDQWWTVSDEATSPWLSVQSLSWAPDSRHILFTHASKPGVPSDDGGPRLLDAGAGFSTSLDTSPEVRRAPKVLCCTVASTGPEYGSVLDARGFARDIVTVDSRTGDVARRLTCCGEVIAVDPAGRSLLMHSTDPDHPGGIYRWSPGDEKPTFLGSLLFEAVWLPGS
jgi:hypothetical protein